MNNYALMLAAARQHFLEYDIRRLNIFPDLPMVLKFYFSDEEFSPELTFLWDRTTLQFVRYETVYYIAGCLENRLLQLMQQMPAE